MASDAHAHPFDLESHSPGQEAVRRALGIAVLSSAWRKEELDYHLRLRDEARRDGNTAFFVSFGIHPQLLLEEPEAVPSARGLLHEALGQGLLDALGEAGLDAFGPHKASLDAQRLLFLEQLDLAIEYGLPLVLHLRKATHELFALLPRLKKLSSLILHSSPLTLRESLSLLERGINAFFSFGTPLLKGKKSAIEALSSLPLERILLETDAPYQGFAPGDITGWSSLALVRQRAFALRCKSGAYMGSTSFDRKIDLEKFEFVLDENFRRALGLEAG